MILRIIFFTVIALLIVITTQSISLFASVSIHTALAAISGHPLRGGTELKAVPIATSDDNVYIAWWTNKTGNDEVMFRASTDGGKTFGDKINLSNSTKSESQDAQIDASGDRVFVTWWERNATSNEPVMRVSNDNGKTFGEILRLSTNGSIGSSGGG